MAALAKHSIIVAALVVVVVAVVYVVVVVLSRQLARLGRPSAVKAGTEQASGRIDQLAWPQT